MLIVWFDVMLMGEGSYMKKGWVQRELYLRRIRPFYDSELIKVITGVRRCGKSILIKQIRQELLDTGIEPERITYLNFEDYTLRSLKESDTFHAHMVDLLNPKIKHYLLCDEIQNVKDFELVVNSLRSTFDVSIFLTGSNARLLSGDLATHLGGRTISLKMMSFSFSEFCTFTELPPEKSSLNEYMKWGGFPLVCSAGTEEMKYAVLSNLYDSIVLKDIIMQSKVSSPHVLAKVVEYLLSTSSSTVSGSSIAKALNADNVKVSEPTVYDYIRYCEDACIISKVERFDIRGKKILSFAQKAYAADLGLFQLKKNRVKGEYGALIETLVHNELVGRGYQVFIGKTQNGEVDFIAQKEGKKFYLQVAYVLESSKTIDREFGAFKDIEDNYPKYVISYDDLKHSGVDGIIHLPLLTFLCDEQAMH